MHSRFPHQNSWISLLVSASLLLTGLCPPSVVGQDRKRKPVVVSFGQPNIWSLEQAHYLLARMHMTNLEIQAKALSDNELDPNLTHGTRIQILKQLLEVGASFDQGVGFQNERIVETARFNDTRRRELITRRDSLQSESLNLSRESSRLETERARMNTDSSATVEAKALKDTEIAKKREELAAVDRQITFHNDELKTLGAEPSGTPLAATVPTPAGSPKLPSGIIDKLTDEQVKKLFGEGRDPKLNATTMLDNTVQLQYEIIAKQLTLLRDEVGPGERLVFLELPQSVYTTPGPGDEKMAQTWWHVNGYTRTDPLLRALLELFEVEQKWAKIQLVPAYVRRRNLIEPVPCKEPENDKSLAEDEKEKPSNGAERAAREKQASEATEKEVKARQNRKKLKEDSIAEIFFGLKCERESAREAVLWKLYREGNALFSRVEQNGARDSNEMVEAIRKLVAVRRTATNRSNEGQLVNAQVEAKEPGSEALTSKSDSKKTEEQRRQRIEQMKDLLLIILSEDDPLRPTSREATDALNSLTTSLKVKDGREFEKGLEFIRLDEEFARPVDTLADIERRSVRAVDIIPRQSSLNVNDVQSTVKATGILAAFKFLFGFAGQVNFQRQREQFEQFIHQELYASGFGKGNRDFGWTFGALPGTKRVAPGVRTTYAALVVPDDAESIVLSARGCYFPRKSYQPLDFNDTGHSDWDDEDRYRRYNCGGEQTYILTIPGGGDTSNFWVTNVDYQEEQKGGEFVTVSVRGNNFSSQMGVLVDGVPLHTTVGLAQPHLMPKRPGSNNTPSPAPASDCPSSVTGICGRFERIDPEQIVFSFRMPANYVGTPTITLIAPGKSVDLNSIPNLRINRTPNVGLRDISVPFMFGRRAGLTITDLQLIGASPGSTRVVALLIGTGFNNARDTVYVNGVEIGSAGTIKTFKSPTLYRLEFDLPADETLTVTVLQNNVVATRAIANPAALKITNTVQLSYDPAVGKKPAIMIVKVIGAGFTPPPRLELGIEGARLGRLVFVSPTEVIVRLTDPKPPLVIRLRDNLTGASKSVVVERPAPEEGKPK